MARSFAAMHDDYLDPERHAGAGDDREASEASIAELGQYAWPGGYEVYYVTEEGLTLCQPCALAEARSGFEQGPVYYGGSAADTDEFTSCDSCGRVIVEQWDADDTGDPVFDRSVAGDSR